MFRRLVFALLLSCDTSSDRTAEIAGVLSGADLAIERTRPALVAGKYALMTGEPISYFRGAAPLYAHDFRVRADALGRSPFAVDSPLVWGIGDAHPENFGALIAADGTVAIEPNDFDAADLVPYLYDLRRFLAGLVFVAQTANMADATQRSDVASHRRDIARRAAVAYAKALSDPPKRFDAPGDPILEDVLSRSRKDRGTELDTLTKLDGTTRVFLRGAYDPTSPKDVMLDLPSYAKDALQTTLGPEPFFQILDAVRKLGSGVASWPRLRAYALVRGATDAPSDDVVLEIKELADSNSAGFYPPGVYFDTVQDRVDRTTRAMWSRPDAAPLWHTGTWVGFPVQIRLESEGQKTVRVKRMEGARGTYEAIARFAENVVRILARVHATASPVSPAPGDAIAARIGDIDGFADEQADVAVDYGDRCVADRDRFRAALDRYGPTLGVPVDPSDAPSAELEALYEGVR